MAEWNLISNYRYTPMNTSGRNVPSGDTASVLQNEMMIDLSLPSSDRSASGSGRSSKGTILVVGRRWDNAT